MNTNWQFVYIFIRKTTNSGSCSCHHTKGQQMLYRGQIDALRFSQSGLSGLKCPDFSDLFAFGWM